ncbi:LXG domain-containing protein [Peribacillus frigoritolerans]|uniref:LXG domain-containing protein n=1 Tax=Peribacillus frigoritolerans TaxID=450367 RepID=UPI0020BFF859|nr:LXG domain-containing protein [Peribacillus frigoritolerans]
MKVLDVSSLLVSLDQTVNSIEKKIEGIEVIEKSIQELVKLDDSFKGKGAESIKFFYKSCHLPFTLKLKQVFTSYKAKLLACKEATKSFEPNEEGFIHQEFLQGELITSIIQSQNYTSDVTLDANRVISSVSDIVELNSLDDTEFNNHVLKAKSSVLQTINQLEEFDQQNSSSLSEVISDLQLLANYVNEIDSKIGSSHGSLENFSPLQLLASSSHSLLISSIKTSPLSFKSTNTTYNESLQSIFILDPYGQYPYSWLGLNFYSNKGTTEINKKINNSNKMESNYMVGEKTNNGNFTFEASAGKTENDWSGFQDVKNGSDQIGGSSSLTGIHVSIEHDTSIIDNSFNQDIGMAEAQASVGGKSILPVVKAGGAVYNAKVKSQLDKEIDYVGSTGVEAKGEILKANAYAGIDNSSIGFGAKAAVAEGEVSGIFPLPFTDYTIKGTAGASAFGAGGEAKIGKEIVLDLRLLIGIKLGLSFEKE